MKKLVFGFLMLTAFVVMLLSGCRTVVIGSGHNETKTYSFTDFTRIEVQQGFTVEIVPSSSFNIEVTTDDNVLEYVDVKKSGDTLIINLEWNRSYVSVHKKAVISMPELAGVALSGGSVGQIHSFPASGSFESSLSGGSVLSGELETGQAEFGLSGGSKMSLEGSADHMTLDSSGGSKADLEDFDVKGSDIIISGGGTAVITLDGVLNAEVSGGSKIYYSGNVEMGSLDISDGSSINKR